MLNRAGDIIAEFIRQIHGVSHTENEKKPGGIYVISFIHDVRQ